MTTKVTDKMIRDHLGHGEGSRKVRVQRNGEVHYYGSRNDTDRQHDYWHFGGYRDELARQVQYDMEQATHGDTTVGSR